MTGGVGGVLPARSALGARCAQLCTWAPDRDGARVRLAKALDSYAIEGVRHNIPFMRAVLDHPQFVDGSASTKVMMMAGDVR